MSQYDPMDLDLEVLRKERDSAVAERDSLRHQLARLEGLAEMQDKAIQSSLNVTGERDRAIAAHEADRKAWVESINASGDLFAEVARQGLQSRQERDRSITDKNYWLDRSATAEATRDVLAEALRTLIPWVEAFRVGPESNDKLYDLIGAELDKARAALALVPQSHAERPIDAEAHDDR